MLTTGEHKAQIVHCEVDGAITIEWADGTTFSGYAMLQGEDRSLGNTAMSITIDSGTFTLA